MLLFLVSFLAGALTVLAPCVLPVLPVIIGGAAGGTTKRNPYTITASLAIAIVLFTLLLKFSTAFINIPAGVWSITSGVIIMAFGLVSLFPGTWERLNIALGLSTRSDKLLLESANSKSRWSDMLIGLSLGPVFSSCSPTYFIILATVLPRSFLTGTIYLTAYAVGLSLVLLLISLLGQRFIKNARWAANPRGWFKRSLGMLFIIVGLFVFTGTDKVVQTYLVEHGYYQAGNFEQNILQKINMSDSASLGASNATDREILPSRMPAATKNFPRYREIVKPAGFVNTSSVSIGELVGKKIILVDFMTYSCINCIRTFPYLNAWYEKYKDQGFEIVGIHTPEFAFEHKIENVRTAMERFGIKFPVVLDNDYGTWGAYSNNYWPRKYLIDIDGYIVYDHIGEGGYADTEEKIQELLAEKNLRDKEASAIPSGLVSPSGTVAVATQSPETYFGAARNEYFGNGTRGEVGTQRLSFTNGDTINTLYLAGTWNITEEHAVNMSAPSQIRYRYAAQKIFFVGSADEMVKVRVLLDGKPVAAEIAGSDIQFQNGQSYLMVKEERLYNIISDTKLEKHLLELIIESPGLKAYTFTFG